MTVGTKKHRNVPVISVDEQVSWVLKGCVEFLFASCLTTWVGSPEAKLSSEHFISLECRNRKDTKLFVASNIK